MFGQNQNLEVLA